MRFVIDTDDGTVTIAQLDDGAVLLKVRAHGVQISAATAHTLSTMLTRVAIEAHLAQLERNMGLLARSMPRCLHSRPAAGPNSSAVQRCILPVGHPGGCVFEVGREG